MCLFFCFPKHRIKIYWLTCVAVFNAYILWGKYKNCHVAALPVLQEDPERRPTHSTARHGCRQRLRDVLRKVGRASARERFGMSDSAL